MSRPPVAHKVLRADALAGQVARDTVTLDYEARFLRRKSLLTDDGLRFLVDLSETLSLEHGDCFVISDDPSDDASSDTGTPVLIEVRAADEALIAVTGRDLVRLAWHIGNRHTPCQIEPERLLIRQDKVMADMLHRLGADVADVIAPFRPEGGAYGLGRTHGHDHSHVHVHVGHGHAHDHDHDHGHDHGDGDEDGVKDDL
ncbi:urease accessory protein UreE [Pseudooceanicola nitratireducens]|uniref:urease accessory protein UreE n=1 Tax=Pseudooceanicola nitratireducens TaxID=517719 RepID=UPI003C7BD18A